MTKIDGPLIIAWNLDILSAEAFKGMMMHRLTNYLAWGLALTVFTSPQTDAYKPGLGALQPCLEAGIVRNSMMAGLTLNDMATLMRVSKSLRNVVCHYIEDKYKLQGNEVQLLERIPICYGEAKYLMNRQEVKGSMKWDIITMLSARKEYTTLQKSLPKVLVDLKPHSSYKPDELVHQLALTYYYSYFSYEARKWFLEGLQSPDVKGIIKKEVKNAFTEAHKFVDPKWGERFIRRKINYMAFIAYRIGQDPQSAISLSQLATMAFENLAVDLSRFGYRVSLTGPLEIIEKKDGSRLQKSTSLYGRLKEMIKK